MLSNVLQKNHSVRLMVVWVSVSILGFRSHVYDEAHGQTSLRVTKMSFASVLIFSGAPSDIRCKTVLLPVAFWV